MHGISITAVLNLHEEGAIAIPSIISIEKAKSRAERGGISVEIVAVLDKANQLTKDVIGKAGLAGVRTVDLDVGDLGEARNCGVRAARGDWVAFLDGDDLWGEDWLIGAYAAALRDPRQIVWHPEVNLYFGLGSYQLFEHLDMEDWKFDPLSLLLDNYWTSLCFARRSLFLEIPYRKVSLVDQIGYEDWAWNMETIGRGVIHKIVPGTGHAIRIKEYSLLRTTRNASALPRPSALFRDNVISPRKMGIRNS